MAKKKEETTIAAPRVPEPWEEKLRARAKDVKSMLTSGIPRITHANQIISVDNQRMAGNKLALIVLGIAWVKTYFEKEFTQGSHDTPGCYAFGHEERGLVHHARSPAPQVEAGVSCDQCPHNRFGTALKGKGKRCSDRPTLLCLLASDLEKASGENAQKVVAKAKEYQLQVPPTSISLLNEYVGGLGTQTDHGDIGEAIMELGVQGRTKGLGYELTFTFLGKVPREAMPFLVARGESAFDRIAQPFPVITESEEEKPQAPVKGQSSKTRR